jgi:hypothetical protein
MTFERAVTLAKKSYFCEVVKVSHNNYKLVFKHPDACSVYDKEIVDCTKQEVTEIFDALEANSEESKLSEGNK